MWFDFVGTQWLSRRAKRAAFFIIIKEMRCLKRATAKKAQRLRSISF